MILRATDPNPERIILNDVITGGPTLPSANVGDTFPGATVGVIDYSFGNFKLEVTTAAGAHERRARARNHDRPRPPASSPSRRSTSRTSTRATRTPSSPISPD